MFITKKINNTDMLMCVIFCIVLCAGILTSPSSASNGARDALYACGNILIPSLFPFMVLAKLFVSSGACNALSKPFSTITRVLFRLPPEAGGVILFSLIGGYPVGASMVNDLYRSGVVTHGEAKRMAYFCVGGGPAFIMGTVGAILLHNSTTGLIIFFSQLLSALIIGIASAVLSNRNEPSHEKLKTSKQFDFSSAITSSCKEASSAMILMCSLVILFGTILSLIKNIVGETSLLPIIAVITEVTAGCRFSALQGMPTELLAFAVGFGGLCVHFQIFSLLSDVKIDKIKFIIIRAIQGLLTAVLSYFGFMLIPTDMQASMIFGNNVLSTQSGTIFGAVALVLMCGIFLVSSKQNKYT